jgi:hypothetical protein
MFISLDRQTGIRRSLNARIRLTSVAELTERILADNPARLYEF